jgi:hypothetical protein
MSADEPVAGDGSCAGATPGAGTSAIATAATRTTSTQSDMMELLADVAGHAQGDMYLE